MADSTGPRPTALGVVVSLLLIAGLLCAGGVVVFMKMRPATVATQETTSVPADEAASDIELVPAAHVVPRLDPAAPYVVKDNVVVVELSEYAGYAGLIAANGGLEPNPDSFFAKNYGFQVKLTLSEEESWSALNSGKIAASATTADVLAVYGRQFQVEVPAQIGFSRGADGIVVRSDIKRLNDLAGKVVVASQFTEAEFFLRYLASEAGIPVHVSDEPKPRDPKAITVVFAEDAFVAGDVFLADLQGANKLAGCVTWEPKTSEVVEASGGKAKVLVTNRNLLVIADILIVNKGFADQNPKMVEGLVDGLLEGNRRVRDNPEQELALVGKAFGWSPADTKDELMKVHLSNLPESLAFFKGEIDMAGSFGGIVQSAIYAYGREIVPEPVAADRFLDLAPLQTLEQGGKYASQTIAIAPIKVGTPGTVEDDPLLSKDIRFFFEPNSSRLDMQQKENLENLASIDRLLQVSPGSTILLRGHVDDAKKAEFRQSGGEPFVRQMAMKAVALSKERADEVERQLVATQKVDDKRVEVVGVGWDEPVGKEPDLNRRVEAQWFTVE
jgi:NitT/TauT family transport system substrate-binding protein